MSRKASTRKKRKYEHGSYYQRPRNVINSRNYHAATPAAYKLLTQLCEQYNGSNNGGPSAAFTVMVGKGWISPNTLSKAFSCLQHYGLVEKTRQGGNNICSLYAITWESIDTCNGKHDARITDQPSQKWSKEVKKWKSKN
jgi:hypothetical protein